MGQAHKRRGRGQGASASAGSSRRQQSAATTDNTARETVDSTVVQGSEKQQGDVVPVAIASTLVAAAVLAVYIRTLFADVPGGDSGELVAEACQLGVGHPPGYPLFILYSRAVMEVIAMLVPSASHGWAANVGAAVCGATAAGLLCASVALLMTGPLAVKLGAGLVTGLLFAFSPLVWTYSVGAEVFAMNNMFVAMVVLLVVVFGRNPSLGTAMVGSFVCGLALTNQHTIVLFVAPVAVWVLWSLRSTLNAARIVGLALCALAGLAPYAYLVWASHRNTPGSWGDLTSISGFFRHLLRSEYGTLQLSPMEQQGSGVWGPFGSRLLAYTEHTGELVFAPEQVPLGWCLATVGAAGLLRPVAAVQGATGRLLVAMWLCYVVVFHYLANLPTDSPMALGVLARFWMQADALFCVAVGAGVATLGKLWAAPRPASRPAPPPAATRSKPRRTTGSGKARAAQGDTAAALDAEAAPAAMSWLAAWSAIALALASIGAGVAQRFALMDHSTSGNTMVAHGRSVLATLPQDAVLLSFTDLNWNTVRYLQQCEGQRPDITHISMQLMPYPWFERQHALYPDITFPPVPRDATSDKKASPYVRDVARFLDANIGDHPDIYMDLHGVFDKHFGKANQYGNTNYLFLPAGLLFKAVPLPQKGSPYAALTGTSWWTQSQVDLEVVEQVARLPNVVKYPEGSWEHAAGKVYWDAHYQRAMLLLEFIVARGRQDGPGAPAAQDPAVPSDVVEQAARAFDSVVGAADGGLSVTYSLQDVLKNQALAHVRLHDTIKDPERLVAVRQHLVTVLRRYLSGAQGDRDRPTFEKIYQAVATLMQGTPQPSQQRQGQRQQQTKQKNKNKRKRS